MGKIEQQASAYPRWDRLRRIWHCINRTILLSSSRRVGAPIERSFYGHALIQMKYFFHYGPPFAGLSRPERFLHRCHDGPPFPRFEMSAHLRHITVEVIANIFEIAEQHIVLQENRVVCDVASTDHFQDFWPDGRMVRPIAFLATSLDSNCHSVSLHTFPVQKHWPRNASRAQQGQQ